MKLPFTKDKMKVRLNGDGSLDIIASGITESLALEAWYDKFFNELGVHNKIPENMTRPLLRIHLDLEKK